MRILLTTESYLPYLSGVTVSVDALARGLGARGHDVLVLGPRPADGRDPDPVGSPGPAPRYAWLPSYQLPRVVPPDYRMPIPIPWSSALSLAREHRPEIVHAHSPFVTGLMARRVARARRVPLVFTHHTRFADYDHYLGPLARPGAVATRAYLRRFWLACDAIIAPSSDLAGEIRAGLPGRRAGRVRVVPTGIDVAGLRSLPRRDVRAALGWPADAPVVASLGRLAPEKSPLTVLEAFALASRSDEGSRLLMIGGGPSEADLRRRAEQPDLARRVGFTGGLPRTEALARLGSADLFAFASRTETQGLVLAEALAVGLPAVAIDGPGVRDTLRDGVDGIVVAADPPSMRAARLGEAMGGLLGDRERRAAMARRAATDAGRFDLGRRIAEVETVYESLHASRAGVQCRPCE